MFTSAVEQIRRAETHRCALPKGARWATMKRPEALTEAQRQALEERETGGFATAEASPCQGDVALVRKADTTQAVCWRLSRFLNHIGGRLLEADSVLDPVRRLLARISADGPSGYQRPSRSAQRPCSRPRQSKGLSRCRNLRVHHLSDRRTHHRIAQTDPFHLKRRRVPSML